ncbi:hypothetical protein WDW37_10705 [Bdellovibrionota bacterium FG-1]
MKRRRLIFLLTLMLMALSITLFTACGKANRDTENYGDTSQIPIRLTTPEQHRGGYGRTECALCHNAALNIHRDVDTMIDADQLLTDIKNGSRRCLDCHGPNGTE